MKRQSILSQIGLSTKEDSDLLKDKINETLKHIVEQKKLIADKKDAIDLELYHLTDHISHIKNIKSDINSCVNALSDNVMEQGKTADDVNAAIRRIEKRLSLLEQKNNENFEVISGFLRLIAANQLMLLQEAYNLDDVSDVSAPTAKNLTVRKSNITQKLQPQPRAIKKK